MKPHLSSSPLRWHGSKLGYTLISSGSSSRDNGNCFYPVYPTSGFPLSICGWHRSFLKHRFSGNTLWETLTYIAIENGPVETVSFSMKNAWWFSSSLCDSYLWEYLHSRWFPQSISISNTLNKWWGRWLNKWPQHHGLGLQRDLPDHALILGPLGLTGDVLRGNIIVLDRCMVYLWKIYGILMHNIEYIYIYMVDVC